jgi:hypothetical protein
VRNHGRACSDSQKYKVNSKIRAKKPKKQKLEIWTENPS